MWTQRFVTCDESVRESDSFDKRGETTNDHMKRWWCWYDGGQALKRKTFPALACLGDSGSSVGHRPIKLGADFNTITIDWHSHSAMPIQSVTAHIVDA